MNLADKIFRWTKFSADKNFLAEKFSAVSQIFGILSAENFSEVIVGDLLVIYLLCQTSVFQYRLFGKIGPKLPWGNHNMFSKENLMLFPKKLFFFTGGEWNGLMYYFTNFSCWCAKKDIGHRNDPNAMHYRWIHNDQLV